MTRPLADSPVLTPADRELMRHASAVNQAAEHLIRNHGGDIAAACRYASMLREVVDFLWPCPPAREDDVPAKTRKPAAPIPSNGTARSAEGVKGDAGAAALGLMVAHLRGGKAQP